MAETGLNQNWNRDYDPLTGRYPEGDPIRLAGGRYSTYAYAKGTPIGAIDPDGLKPLRTENPQELQEVSESVTDKWES